MPDLIQERLSNPAVMHAGDTPHTFVDKLRLESDLLGGGVKDGFLGRLNQARENPAWTALEFGGTAAIGFGLTMLQEHKGKLGTAARIATQGLKYLAVADVTRRLVPTACAMSDTWSNPTNLDANKSVVAKNLGSALFDYPLMAAGGMAGSYGASRALRSLTSLTADFPSSPRSATISDAYSQTKGIGEFKTGPNRPFDFNRNGEPKIVDFNTRLNPLVQGDISAMTVRTNIIPIIPIPLSETYTLIKKAEK